MANLFEMLIAKVRDAPAHVFAMLPDGTRLNYADVERLSARYAGALTASGVTAGDRVMVQAEKSIEMLMLYLGCLRAGAIFLPLNTAYTAGELEYFFADAEPSLVVCAPDSREIFAKMAEGTSGVRVETLDESGSGSLPVIAAEQPDEFTTFDCEDDWVAAILYTSGTTGRSKGAMLSHGNLASNALTLLDYWCFSEHDVLLHALPIFHTHGLFVATNLVLTAGAAMIFLSRFSPVDVLSRMPEATVLMGVPTYYIRLLDETGLTRGHAANMRLFISGSAPLSADIHREFRERTGHAILERYGMTETNMNTSNPYDGDRIAGTVGLPLPGIDIRIADPDTGTPLPQGEVGVIEISGPNVFKGYWRMPEKTREAFRNGYFISGDLGFLSERGYVSIVGREKDLIIAGGLNIYPAEVENALDSLPEVHESAVIGVPHRDLGEAVVAVLVPRDPQFDDAEIIGEGLAGKLARFKQPRQIVFRKALPKNAMGKVQKNVLRDHYASLFS